MVTFYVDIYFLINFTVDTLAIAFAYVLAGVRQRKGRTVVGALFGSLFAVITVLLPEYIALKLLGGALGLLAVVMICAADVSNIRKARFGASFLIFCALLGGMVTYLFDIFEKLLGDSMGELSSGGINRKLLLIAVAILIAIGLFKLIVALFSGKAVAGCVTVKFYLLGDTFEGEGLIDSGNLACDPMDSSPVILIKESAARQFLPDTVIHLSNPDLLPLEYKKKIRLIPVSGVGGTRVLCGIKPDKTELKLKEKYEEIRATIAIDREGGDFGGYGMLVPAAAIYDGKK